MLNELITIERAVEHAGIQIPHLHPSMKTAGKSKLVLRVLLSQNGDLNSIRPVNRETDIWTLREGQHNSFPFIQPKCPLWEVADLDREILEVALSRKRTVNDRRKALVTLAQTAHFNNDAKNWPKAGTLNYLSRLHGILLDTRDVYASVFLATVDRLLIRCREEAVGDSQHVLRQLMVQLIQGLESNPQDIWFEIALAHLIGAFDEHRTCWNSKGALLFEAAGFTIPITEMKVAEAVTAALIKSESSEVGICALTGEKASLLTGNFPQPKLPVVGQTYLFAKNRDIPAYDRYIKFSEKGVERHVFPVGRETACRLDGAFRILTCAERNGITWRSLPGEMSKPDLLLAFSDQALEAQVAETLTDEELSLDSIAKFEKRTERLLQAFQAETQFDMGSIYVRFYIFRGIDKGNAKVVYADSSSAAALKRAAEAWIVGEKNVPSWLELPIKTKGEGKLSIIRPPHIAPLSLVNLSRQLYTHNGSDRQDVPGLSAAEAMWLFIDRIDDKSITKKRRATRVLRLILTRRTPLVASTADASRRRANGDIFYDNCSETLRTVTVIGVLLNRIGRRKEVYMNEIAFKLGQLLAAADSVHVGYCADIRGGDVPPALLGNQVFAMAQRNPGKALAILCGKWKPYSGWAQKAARDPKLQEKVALQLKSESRIKRNQAWDIKKALRCARDMGPMAEALAPMLGSCQVDDIFRAELLLGYMAGLPKSHQEGRDTESVGREGQEE